MEDLRKQPFLLSMQQAVEKTGDLDAYETLLYEQQEAFKKYLDEHFNSEMPAPKRFRFLKRADWELCNIRQKYADKIREADEKFFQFWAMLIEETLRFIAIGIETLEFQARCPAHMLVEASQKYPSFKWMSSRTDLAECLLGIYQVDVIRLQDGSRPSFVLFAKFIGDFFGISYKYLYSDIRRLLTRKKSQTPFLLRIIEGLKIKNLKIDDLKD